MDSISRSQLQKGDVFRKQYEEEIYKNALKKYTTEVVDVITKDLVSLLNSRAQKIYVYRFGKPYILGHPIVPPSQNKSLYNVYQNEVEKIYPVKEIFNELQHKFPDCKVTMDVHTYNITIDWS
jgi:hypothetical protein